jgi:iron complex outermembrane receptor protein
MCRSPHRLVITVAAVITAGCASGGSAPPASTPDSGIQKNAVSGDVLARSGDVPIEQILADRVAGVRLGHASDGTLTVTIRGSTNWNTDNQPLYVLDGVPITPGPGGALSGINPLDIAKIEVLKDAASTAMYGLRGANGVIVIKTKKK